MTGSDSVDTPTKHRGHSAGVFFLAAHDHWIFVIFFTRRCGEVVTARHDHRNLLTEDNHHHFGMHDHVADEYGTLINDGQMNQFLGGP